MIVKDEAKNMPALLESVRGVVDCFAIVDTGNGTTVDAIHEATHGWLTGQVIVATWKDFASARNQALDLARQTWADWALVIDADDDLQGNKDLTLEPGITYFLPRKLQGLSWHTPNLLWLLDDWRWSHPIHETCEASKFKGAAMTDTWIDCNVRTGARSGKGDKVRVDVALLRQLVADKPDDARSWFYLAISLMVLGETDEASVAFQRRVELAGWSEELFVSHYQIARILLGQGRETDQAIQHLLAAIQQSPDRAEALVALARVYTALGNPLAAELPMRLASQKTLRPEFLFAESELYGHLERGSETLREV